MRFHYLGALLSTSLAGHVAAEILDLYQLQVTAVDIPGTDIVPVTKEFSASSVSLEINTKSDLSPRGSESEKAKSRPSKSSEIISGRWDGNGKLYIGLRKPVVPEDPDTPPDTARVSRAYKRTNTDETKWIFSFRNKMLVAEHPTEGEELYAGLDLGDAIELVNHRFAPIVFSSTFYGTKIVSAVVDGEFDRVQPRPLLGITKNGAGVMPSLSFKQLHTFFVVCRDDKGNDILGVLNYPMIKEKPSIFPKSCTQVRVNLNKVGEEFVKDSDG